MHRGGIPRDKAKHAIAKRNFMLLAGMGKWVHQGLR
jgi:hypothetical protein